VALYLDSGLNETLIDELTIAFVPHTPHGRTSVDVLTTAEDARLAENVDVVVIVLDGFSGEGPCHHAALEVARKARAQGKPTSIVCTDQAILRSTLASGFGVSILDTVVADDAATIFDKLADWIAEVRGDSKLAFAVNYTWMRRRIAKEAINNTAMQNGAVGLVVFIPGADLPVMTLNQAKMILQIAAIYGEPMSMDRVKELAVVIGGGFALRQVARTAIGFVPVLGWAIKATVGYTGTLAMGNAALEYFERGGSPEGLVEKLGEAKDGLIRSAHEKQAARHDGTTKTRIKKTPRSVKSSKKVSVKEKSGYHRLT
jgi:uncharacterized protein (DUF697 family)